MGKISLITISLVIIVVVGYTWARFFNNVGISFLIGGITMWIVSMIAFDLRR